MYFNPKANYCLFTKCMVISLIINQYLYLIFYYIPNDLYQKLYTFFAFGIALIGYVALKISLKRNKKYKNV